MFNQPHNLSTAFDNLWNEPEPADFFTPDPPEPEMELGINDDVIAHGRNGVDYTGYVLDTDPYQNLALVKVWDHQVGAPYTAWWEVAWLDMPTAVAA
jgi:hypothetical protein